MTLGTDLSVLIGFAAHDASAVDLQRTARPSTPLTVRLLEAHGGHSGPVHDLATLSERENVAQAMILRLLTPQGSLSALGHAGYGSRLHLLIGEPKSDALRNLCRVYVLEAVRQEPRVQDAATQLDFDPRSESASEFRFTLGIAPVTGGDPVTLGLEVAL